MKPGRNGKTLPSDSKMQTHITTGIDAFWRTMITNQILGDAASKYVKAPEHIGLEYERWSRQTGLKNTLDARAKAPEQDFYDFVANLIIRNGAHFFRSKGRYIGLGC